MPKGQIVATWPADERAELFEEATARLSRGSPVAIEKDYWVCWTLRHVFATTQSSSLVFKGGTSLSKVYRVIDRFSEDIDLSVDRRILGYEGDQDPTHARSKSKASQLVKAIPEACSAWVLNVMLPELRTLMSQELPASEGWSLNNDPNEPSTLLLAYPPALSTGLYGTAGYIAPKVRLEFGGRNELWPSEKAAIVSYVAEALPDVVPDRPSEVSVLAPVRTFWEKATILHAEYHRLEDTAKGERLSRHYYDVAMLARTEIAEEALLNDDLRKVVVQHKQLFFPSRWAHYETARPGSFHLTPTALLEAALRKDYSLMREMFFTEPPTFDEILEILRQLEDRINHLNEVG